MLPRRRSVRKSARDRPADGDGHGPDHESAYDPVRTGSENYLPAFRGLGDCHDLRRQVEIRHNGANELFDALRIRVAGFRRV